MVVVVRSPTGLFEGGSAKKAKNRRLHRGMTLPLQTFLKLDNDSDGLVAAGVVPAKDASERPHKPSELAATARTLGHVAPTLLAHTPHRVADVPASLSVVHPTIGRTANPKKLPPPAAAITAALPGHMYGARTTACHAAPRPFYACRAIRQVAPQTPPSGHHLDHGDAAMAAARSSLIDLRHFVVPPDSDVEFARLTPDPDSLYDDSGTSGASGTTGAGSYFMGVRRDWFGDGRALLVPTDALTALVQAQIALVRRDGDEIYGYDHAPARLSQPQPPPPPPSSSALPRSVDDQAAGDDGSGTPAHFWLPSGIDLDSNSDSDSDVDNSEVSAILAGDKRGGATQALDRTAPPAHVSAAAAGVGFRPTFTEQRPTHAFRVPDSAYGRGPHLVGRDLFAGSGLVSRTVQVSRAGYGP